MIELIYLENSLYIKRRLEDTYQEYLEANCDMLGNVSFQQFVEKAYTGVLNWYSFNKQNDDSALNIINCDTELAEDLLDSISALDVELATDWDMYFRVEYVERNSSIIVEYDFNSASVILPDPASYAHSYNKIRNSNLTKLARLLNVLRTSKVGEHS